MDLPTVYSLIHQSSHNQPFVGNICKNTYFSFSSKSGEVKLNVSSNSRSCDMSGSGGNVSSSHLYPRNLWCVMAKYATQGNVQIPLPRSKAQRFSQSKTNHMFSRFLFSLHITADPTEIAIAAVLLVQLLHLVTIVRASIAGQFRTGFRSNDSGTSHLIQDGGVCKIAKSDPQWLRITLSYCTLNIFGASTCYGGGRTSQCQGNVSRIRQMYREPKIFSSKPLLGAERCSWELWSPLISFFHALRLKIPASREVESPPASGAAVPVSCLLSFMRGEELSRACWVTHAKFYPLTSRIYVKSINVVRVISQIQETRYLDLTM